jgi:hypothetical protein
MRGAEKIMLRGQAMSPMHSIEDLQQLLLLLFLLQRPHRHPRHHPLQALQAHQAHHLLQALQAPPRPARSHHRLPARRAQYHFPGPKRRRSEGKSPYRLPTRMVQNLASNRRSATPVTGDAQDLLCGSMFLFIMNARSPCTQLLI